MTHTSISIRRPDTRMRRAGKAFAGFGVAGLLAIAGCGTTEPAPPALSDADLPTNTSLAALSAGAWDPGELPANPLRRDMANEASPEFPVAPASGGANATADPASAPGALQAVPIGVPANLAPGESSTPRTTEEKYAAALAELMQIIADRAATSSVPLADNLRLAALSQLSATTPGSEQPSGSLSSGERQRYDAMRPLLSAMLGPGAATMDDSGLISALDTARAAIAPARGVRILDSALCRRVDGFGSFEPFASGVFAAGRSQRVILYVELDGFAYRPLRDGDRDRQGATSVAQWAVEVSQELQLIHDADGTLQWYQPEQTLVDLSRNKRRDFYLVNSFELPATLTVGLYKLKVTVRDKVTGGVDERIVPITIVADPGTTQQANKPTQ